MTHHGDTDTRDPKGGRQRRGIFFGQQNDDRTRGVSTPSVVVTTTASLEYRSLTPPGIAQES